MDVVLCQFRRPWSPSVVRKYSLLRYGICWHAGYGMGLDHRHGLHPMCCYGNGYDRSLHVVSNANIPKAELCSSMPTSGGLYYAAAVLAPPGYGPLASWITGWSNWLAQVTGAPSVDYALSAMILAAASIGNPTYIPQNYQVWLLTTFILCIHGCISSMPTRWIAIFNSYGSSFNIIALIIVIILIPAKTSRPAQGLPRFTPSSEVWSNFYVGTDYPAGLSVLLSFVSVIWTMSGSCTQTPT
jgi:amino acid transporter